MVHAMRARHDAVMVGAGTARADDPSLTVRGIGITRQPARVVVSRRLDLPRDGALARTAHEVPLFLCHGPDAEVGPWHDLGAVLLPVPVEGGQVDAGAALSALAGEGITRVFCEGGGTLAASLLSADLVDELVVFGGGVAIGAEGTPGLAAMGIATLSEAPRFTLSETRNVAQDVLTVWRRT